MKILISADIEGINGLYRKSELKRRDKQTYFKSCQLMTQDLNFVASLLHEHEIVVVDGHGKGNNLIIEELTDKVTLLERDSDKAMLTGVDDCDAMILLGYHEMAGKNTFCSHTNSTPMIKSLVLNGKDIGETGCAFMMSSEFNVPIIAIIGTDGVLNEIDKNKVSFIKACDSKSRLRCTPVDREIFEIVSKYKIEQGLKNMYYYKTDFEEFDFEIYWKKDSVISNEDKVTWNGNRYCSFSTTSFEEGYKIYRSLLDANTKKNKRVKREK